MNCKFPNQIFFSKSIMKQKKKRRSTLRQILEEEEKIKQSKLIKSGFNPHLKISPEVSSLEITILPDLEQSLTKRFNKPNLFSPDHKYQYGRGSVKQALARKNIPQKSKKTKLFCLNFKPKIDEKIVRKTVPLHNSMVLNKTISKRNLSRSEPALLKYCRLLLRCKVNGNKRKTKFVLLMQQMIQKYQNNSDQFQKQVGDISKLSSVLIMCLLSKGQEIQLKSTGALEVNRDLARLIFHMVQQLLFMKINKENVLKISKEIQFYSRRLNFHRLTLKVCFDIATVYKQYYKDEFQSANYYGKALRQAIFVGDKYNEQKAIDSLGLVAYLEGKIEGASFCHNRIQDIKNYERYMKAEQFSNEKQIEKLYQEKKEKADSGKVVENLNEKNSSQNYAFMQGEYDENFDINCKQKFKKKIKYYIQNSDMRQATIKANATMNKIDMIGLTQKDPANLFKEFRSKNIENGTRQILLTHRSFNRLNPDTEHQEIERDKRLILDFLKQVEKKSGKLKEDYLIIDC